MLPLRPEYPMPRKPKEPTPNRLLESAYAIGDFEPRLGFLHLETDEGLIVLAINTTVAGELAKTLIDFMAIRQADYEDDLEEPANDA